MSRLRSLRSAVGGAVAGVIGHHYGGKLLSYKEDKNEELMQTERDQALMSMREKMENVERQLVEVNERISRQNTLLDNKVESEIAEFKDDVVEVSNIVGTGTTNIEEGRKSLDMSFSNNLDDANFKKGIEYLNEGKENLVNASNKLSELLEKLNGKNQFIGESEITSLYKYLDSLNILEESAIFHIVIILTIICIV
jgi:exonuclease VII small subunit